MPLAVVHIIPTISLFGYLKRKLFPKEKIPFALFVVALGSLLPDIDIVLNWILEIFGYAIAHGTITHTPFFALCFIALAVPFILLKKKAAIIYLLLITAGIISHIFLDYLIGGGSGNGVMWFFPLSEATYKIHLISFIPINNLPEAIDAITLMVWIFLKSPWISEGEKIKK